MSYPCGTTQIDLPEPIANHLRQLQQFITTEDLAAFGIDVGPPHITLRWGIITDQVGALEALAKRYLPCVVRLGNMGYFSPSVSSGGAGVLHVQIVPNEILSILHTEIGSHIDSVPYQFSYTPHATIAYIKPECAAKYLELDYLKDVEFIASAITFSNKDNILSVFNSR